MKKWEQILDDLIDEEGYLENDDVLAIFAYGSHVTGNNTKQSDLDVNIIMKQHCTEHSCSKVIDGLRVEYFERPIHLYYNQVQEDIDNQSFYYYNVFQNYKPIYNPYGTIEHIKSYVFSKYSHKTSIMTTNEALDEAAKIANKIRDLEDMLTSGDPLFENIYQKTLTKIRHLHGRMHGLHDIEDSKVYRTYKDKKYRQKFIGIDRHIPDPKFCNDWLRCANPKVPNFIRLYLLKKLFQNTIESLDMDVDNYRIDISHRLLKKKR